MKTFIIIIDRIYCYFFIFYLVGRVYVWPTTFQIYFMTFVIQKINITKDKITTFHLCFQPSLISFMKWFKQIVIINHELCFISNHDFYVIAISMHYTLLISVFRGGKVNCYSQLNFPCIRVFRHFICFRYGLFSSRYSLNDRVFYHNFSDIQYNCCSKHYLLLLVCNNLFLAQKGS